MKPTTFVQQINTVSAFMPGRLSINIVAGSSIAEQRGYGDYLAHDERYARAEEFLAVCHSFWRGDGDVNFDGKYYQVDQGKLHTPFFALERSIPEIYISGHSEQAEQLARLEGNVFVTRRRHAENLAIGSRARARARYRSLSAYVRHLQADSSSRRSKLPSRLLPDSDLGQYERSVAVKNDSQMYREASQVERSDG